MTELPRPIKFHDIRKGDTIHQTVQYEDMTFVRIGVACSKESEDGFGVWRTERAIPLCWLSDDDKDNATVELVDRPIPPIPDWTGAAIRATTIDGDECPVLIRSRDGMWFGIDGEGLRCLFSDGDMVEWEEVTIIPKENQ